MEVEIVNPTAPLHAVRKVLASHIEEALPIDLAVNCMHLLQFNSWFFCGFPRGGLEINDKTCIAGRKGLSLADNIFDPVLLVFWAYEEILRCHSPPNQPLSNLFGTSTKTVFCCIAIKSTRGRCRVSVN